MDELLKKERKRESNRRWCQRNKEKKRESSRQWYQCNKDKVKTSAARWTAENRPRVRELACKRRESNRDEIRKYARGWARANPETLRKWREKNPEKVRASKTAWRIRNPQHQREYRKRRYREDSLFRLSVSLRRRLGMAIRGNQKSGSAVRDLGMPIAEFKNYVASLFTDGMSWENWGTVWHLDHIKPLAAFDLADRPQFLEACHYTNLQPLAAEENLKKGARYAS